MMSTKKRFARLALLMAVVALTLVGCGGGGNAGAPVASVPPPAPVPAPPPPPGPVTSVPAPNYTLQAEVDAFNHFNAIRASVGLGLLAQNTKVDQAAQNHAAYDANNNVIGHLEATGNPGFTGVDAGARLAYVGYSWGAWGEVINYPLVPGAQSVDQLLSLPYHRLRMLNFKPVHLGIGVATYPTQSYSAMVFDMAYPLGGAQGAPNLPAAILPISGATGVPKAMLEAELPNPIPENNGAPAGYPISLQIDESRVLSVTSFTVTDPSGAVVATKLLQPSTDPILLADGVRYFACALPRSPLAPSTTYRVSFSGTVDGTPLTKTWSFTTGQ